MDVLIGTTWSHMLEPSFGAMFPADLPSEWKLSFYVNEYRSLFVERSACESWSREHWQRNLDEVTNRFRFVLESTVPAVNVPSGEIVSGFCEHPVVSANGIREVPVISSAVDMRVNETAIFWNVDVSQNIRPIRDLIDRHYASETRVDRLYIFVDGRKNVAKYLQELKILLELMGY